MKLITNAGVEINLEYVRVIDVKPGEKLVYRMMMPTPPTQDQINQIAQGITQLFGEQIPIIFIGPHEDFLVIKEEAITHVIAMAKKNPVDPPTGAA